MKSLYDGSIWAFNCVTLDASLLHDCWKEKPVPYLKKISLFNTTAKWTTLLIPWLWTQRSKCWALIVKTWSSEYNYEPWMPVLMGNVPISWNKPLFRPWNIQVLLGWFLVPSIHFWCTRTLQVPCVHFWCTHTPLIPCVHFLLWCTLHYGVEKIFEVFLGIGILLVIINFFVPTLVTRFWYFVYTSSDHKGVRMVPCVHFWCMCTLLVPCIMHGGVKIGWSDSITPPTTHTLSLGVTWPSNPQLYCCGSYPSALPLWRNTFLIREGFVLACPCFLE